MTDEAREMLARLALTLGRGVPAPLRRRWRRWRGCPACHGTRRLLRYGGGSFAALHTCRWCDDGRKLADTLIPTVTVKR